MIKIQEEASFPSSIYTRNTFLRSLVVDCNYGTYPKIVLSKLVDQLTCLRSLSLNKCSIEEIPLEINKLIHLRYLDLSENNNIEKLPDTLCEFYNLQILDISWCGALRKLPQGIGNLINLRHLLNWGINNIRYMPKSLQQLTGLRILLLFVIKLENLIDAENVKGIGFNNKENLRDLDVDFEGSMNEVHDDEELLEYLPPLGNLPSLEILLVVGMKSVKRVDNEFLGIESDAISSSTSIIAFPKLKFLSFWRMEEWEEWNYDITNRVGDISVMPSLKTLEISGCPKLTSLPNHLRQMSTLKKEFYNCPLHDE
ncbi:putative disease resistance RPP13-like protein 1 [Mangifera indica]|uniref:putative disease resistance RPP13-like protein 1 n=1 Tax=Mangifera indica TaxID=29780 RepID=UPI001CFA8A67|nr:putative disease resistance RPP13-like protein 1 [Mangifera indica]